MKKKIQNEKKNQQGIFFKMKFFVYNENFQKTDRKTHHYDMYVNKYNVWKMLCEVLMHFHVLKDFVILKKKLSFWEGKNSF